MLPKKRVASRRLDEANHHLADSLAQSIESSMRIP